MYKSSTYLHSSISLSDYTQQPLICSVQNYTALHATLTSDEEQFISVLLTGQYQQMGKIKFHEMVLHY